jgi:hypothetical protein
MKEVPAQFPFVSLLLSVQRAYVPTHTAPHATVIWSHLTLPRQVVCLHIYLYRHARLVSPLQASATFLR